MRIRPVRSNQDRWGRGPFRNTPYHVHRYAAAVLLQDQYARSFGIVGIVLDNYPFSDPCQYVSGKDPIRCQFIVAMVRYSDLSKSNQAYHLPEWLTHSKPCQSHIAIPAASRGRSLCTADHSTRGRSALERQDSLSLARNTCKNMQTVERGNSDSTPSEVRARPIVTCRSRFRLIPTATAHGAPAPKSNPTPAADGLNG